MSDLERDIHTSVFDALTEVTRCYEVDPKDPDGAKIFNTLKAVGVGENLCVALAARFDLEVKELRAELADLRAKSDAMSRSYSWSRTQPDAG